MNLSSLQIVTWSTVAGAVASALTLAMSEPTPAERPAVAGRGMVEFVPHLLLEPVVGLARQPKAGGVGEGPSRDADPLGY